MRDELNKNRKSTENECLVLNIDHSNNEGTHWTCLFIKDENLYYFNSYGLAPPLEVLDYYKCKNRWYTTFKIQQDDELQILCGHYCIYVLFRLSNGYNFGDILNELVRIENI